MKHRVYKSLDSTASLFGIRGSNLMFILAGAAAGLLLGLLVGTLTVGFIGFAVIILVLVATYLGVIAFQSRFTEKERDKLIAKGSIPDVIVFQPKRIRDFMGVELKLKRKSGK